MGGDDDKLTAEERRSMRMRKVFDRAMRRFDATVLPQQEIRALALMARRFAAIPGAQWEGPWGDQWEHSIKVEVNKVLRGVRKIETDYRQNRIVPDFRPAGGESDPDTANTLDGIHRADSYHFKAQQARDNAFSEALRGGFGAYRLCNVRADPYDKDSDAQRVNPGHIIVDADQSVFFDGNSKLYDKSDARFCFVITANTVDAYHDEWGDERPTDFPEGVFKSRYDWYTPEIIRTAEYYEVEEKEERLLIFRRPLTDEEERIFAADIDDDDIAEMQALGWSMTERRQKRRRVHKYIMSGAEIMEDCGYIAGDCIPIVPVYGNREFIDNQERFTGYVQSKMDSQRLYNAKVSKLAETDALAPREIPIFAAEQMPPNLQALWANQNIERHPYALVNPLVDPLTGQIISAGPIGKIEPPQLPPVTAALLQVANQDLVEDDQDGADEVKANVSAEAMDIAATRVDAKSGLFLDNMRQSVQREGEIYLSMAKDCYFEPGRIVETMTEDGEDGEATLHDEAVDDRGTFVIRNDFSKGRYKVIADVTEATATRRDKTVKSSLYTADVATKAGDQELAQAALITAVMNQDGEGMDDLQRYARRKGVAIGLVEPNEEEKAEMAAAAESAPPDPTQVLAEAQAKALDAQAAKDLAAVEKTGSDIDLNQAKVVETLAKAGKSRADAIRPANDIAPSPRIRFGRDVG